MPKYISNYKIFVPTIIVFIADQLTKYLISVNMNPVQRDSINIISHYLKFTYIINPGAAFGIEVNNTIVYSILFLVTLLITAYLIYYLFSVRNKMNYESFSLSLILGGALGNLLDRTFTLFEIAGYTGVIDFIDIGLKDESAWRWYTFNIADMSVSIGICLYLLCSYLYSNSKEKIIDENS